MNYLNVQTNLAPNHMRPKRIETTKRKSGAWLYEKTIGLLTVTRASSAGQTTSNRFEAFACAQVVIALLLLEKVTTPLVLLNTVFIDWYCPGQRFDFTNSRFERLLRVYRDGVSLPGLPLYREHVRRSAMLRTTKGIPETQCVLP